MHEPLFENQTALTRGSYLAQERRNVRSAKSAEAILCRVRCKVALIDRRSEAGEHEERLKITLKEYVDVYPLAYVASHAHVTSQGIEDIAAGGTKAPLNAEIIRERGQVIPSAAATAVTDSRIRSGRDDLLIDLVCAKEARQIEILR